MLGYDRSLDGDGEVRVGVLTGERGRSRVGAQRMEQALSDLVRTGLTVAGRGVTVVPVSASTAEALADQVRRTRVAVLYVPEDHDLAVAEIAGVTRSADVLSFTSTAAGVHAGLSVGLVADDHRAHLLISLPAAREEGADLAANLLALATVLR